MDQLYIGQMSVGDGISIAQFIYIPVKVYHQVCDKYTPEEKEK